jgi:hypothetical protein
MQNDFLKDEGINLLDAWLKTGMAAPFAMASTTWGSAPTPAIPFMSVSTLSLHEITRRGEFSIEADTFNRGSTVGIKALVQDEEGAGLSGAQVFIEIRDNAGGLEATIQGFTDDQGLALLDWKTNKKQTTGTYTATVSTIIKSGYEFDDSTGVLSATFTIQ